MTGKQLFDLWVAMRLCADFIYEWEKLSDARRANWNEMAEEINTKGACYRALIKS
jgi:hypothetical protein